MPTNFNEKNAFILHLYSIAQKYAKINSILTTKYTLKSPKVAINILKSRLKSSKSPKSNFTAPKVAKFALFLTNSQSMPPHKLMYGNLTVTDRQTYDDSIYRANITSRDKKIG